MSRLRPALLVAALLALGIGGVASAHVTLDRSSVPADSTQTLQARVPGEDPPAHTVKLIIEVPAGFTAQHCDTPLGWSCALAVNTEQGRSGLITWTRDSGTSAIDLLSFTVRTPSKNGDYAFQADQFYSDGKKVYWDQGPDGEHPAPVVTVTGARSAPVKNTAAPVTHPTPSAAAPTTKPTRDTAAAPTAAVTSSVAPAATGTATPTSTTSAASAAITTVEPISSTAPLAIRPGPEKDTQLKAWPVVAAVVASAAAAGAVVLRRKAR